jgi:hypothetical protein
MYSTIFSITAHFSAWKLEASLPVAEDAPDTLIGTASKRQQKWVYPGGSLMEASPSCKRLIDK